ncbi:MAG: hypothetical protein ACI9DH_000867 [Halioglobus sp.]|jgi:hypothetical protein
MNETIFSDRRKELKRRIGIMPYGLRDCRRTARDRRRHKANETVSNWWLRVDYASNPI